MSDIVNKIVAFHDESLTNPHDRFRSWDHCYRFFQNRPSDYDLASLHLGFYLASWGMYRGSGFLLQNDYRIHLDAAKEVLDQKYLVLKNLSFDSFSSENKEGVIKKLFDLLKRIKTLYGAANVSDTLATKILLGTLGCIPAYDRFFIVGIRAHGLHFSYLNPVNFRQTIDFCLAHRSEFEEAQARIAKDHFQYLIMKIIDMYFWRVGEEADDSHE